MNEIEKTELIKSLKFYASGKKTICEVHREMYDIILTLDDKKKKDELIKKVEEAFIMAKKMNNKLVEYNKDYGKEMKFVKLPKDETKNRKKRRSERK